jgi:hypothetical protein
MSLPHKQPYGNASLQLPQTFPVGKHNPAPLVTVEELQAHLRILGAFSKLKEHVHQSVNGTEKEKDEGWVVYVSRAVHRFGVFMGTEWTSAFSGWKEETAPPLDVLMVLHSYLLVRTFNSKEGPAMMVLLEPPYIL